MVSTQAYNTALGIDPALGTKNFGHADIDANLAAGVSYKEMLDYLNANPGKLSPDNVPGKPQGAYEIVKRNAAEPAFDFEAFAALNAENQRAADERIAQISADNAANQERLAAEQQERLRQLEIASRTAQQNQLAGSQAAQLQLQSISNLPGSQGGTSAFKRKTMQIKPQVSTGLSPTTGSLAISGINV